MPTNVWLIFTAVGAAAVATPLVVAAADASSTQPAAPRRRIDPPITCLVLVVMTGLLCWHLGPTLTVVCAPLLLIGAAAALVDAREQRLPDVLTGPLLASTLAAIGLHTLAQGDDPGAARAVAGLTITFAALGLAKILSPDTIGWGDIKLAPSLGAYLGWISWQALYTGTLLWWLLILLTAMTCRAHSGKHADPVPYGPAMILGTVLGLALS